MSRKLWKLSAHYNLLAHLPIAIGNITLNQHIRLKIPNAGAAALDDVFDSQNKRHVEVNNQRRAKCNEGSVNKEKSDLR